MKKRDTICASGFTTASGMSGLPGRIVSALKRFGAAWGLPDLNTRLSVEFSVRMRRSLGTARVRRSSIRLNQLLKKPENRRLLQETLCHEAAHVAAVLLHGHRVKPHGPQWRQLVAKAGFPARTSIDPKVVVGHVPAPNRQRKRYRYFCPACNRSCYKSVRASHYRCAACLSSGRSGKFIVSLVTEKAAA